MKRVVLLGSVVFSMLFGCGSQQSSTQEPVTGSGQTEPITLDRADPASEGLVLSQDTCTTDADCVADGCCHAAACISRERATGCADVMCTAECRFGTLDCGGSCLCHEGRCAARLSVAPVIEGESPQK